jgi:hypothetical protein
VGRHTNPVSSLGKYVLCGFDRYMITYGTGSEWTRKRELERAGYKF